jgi:hypothetical protein
MPKRAKRVPTFVFRLHLELEDVAPVVWRKLLVPANITLADLHAAVNEAMGWTNSHLHQFVHGTRRFGDFSMPDAGDDPGLEDERKVCLDELVGVGEDLGYDYDYGDGWSHRVRVEKKLELDPRLQYPLCVGGARACPPEDCGGPPGYDRLLELLEDDEAPEHDDTVTWVGGHFDPKGFDVNRTNVALRERCR